MGEISLRKLYAIITVVIMLTACTNSASVSRAELPDSRHQAMPEREIDITSKQSTPVESSAFAPDAQEIIEYYPFIIPETEHIHKDKMVQQLDEFSVEVIFPEFQDIEHLDYSSSNVSTNIYQLAYSRNKDLVLQGGGISQDDLEIIEKLVVSNFPENQRHSAHRTARRDDMTMIGREYFGEQFEFPVSLIAPEITPLDKSSTYYIFSSLRAEGLPSINYVLLDATEENDMIVATFLPFIVRVNPPDNMVHDIEFFNLTESIRNNYYADLETPIEFQLDVQASCYLNDVSCLPVPQEELGTITVTFRLEDTGNLIATSCKYNRK